MKKRTVYMIAGIVIACVLAYFSGYYFMYEKPQKEFEKVTLERNLLPVETIYDKEKTVYYTVKIEENMMHIYQMPERIIYDSIDLSSFQLSKEEERHLREGIEFNNLTEVFEFLENSMS